MPIEAMLPRPSMIREKLRQREPHALWHLFGWGGGAAVALVAVALASLTQRGDEQLSAALTAPPPAAPMAVAELPPRVVKTERLVDTDAEVLRLAAQVRALTADRDRLSARLANLEQGLDDVTGSIKQQAERVAKAAPVAAPAPPPPPLSPPPSTGGAAPLSPPLVNVLAPDDPPSPAIAPLALLPRELSAAWPDAPAKPEPKAEPQSELTIGTRLEFKPEPKINAKSAPAEATAPPPATIATLVPIEEKPAAGAGDFAVDLGGSWHIDNIHKRWAAVKAAYGPDVAGLEPRMGHEKRPGYLPYRLVVGPLPNKAAADKLCAHLTPGHYACRPTHFSGDKLASP
jgi:hypothetical protein